MDSERACSRDRSSVSYSDIVEATLSGVWVVDAERRTTFVNPAWRRCSAMPRRDARPAYARLRRSGADDAFLEKPVALLHKDGSTIWVSTSSGALPQTAAWPRWSPISRLASITAPKSHRPARMARGEAALRESEARKSAILEAALDCIISMDAAGVSPNSTLPRRKPSAAVVQMSGPGHGRADHSRAVSRSPPCGSDPPAGKRPIGCLNRRIELTALRADGG